MMKRKTLSVCCLSILILVLPMHSGLLLSVLHAQSDLIAKVDSLFSEYDSDESPGVAVGILKDGEVVYKH